MKKCLSCEHAYTALEFDCPKCGWKPTTIGGFLAHAPAFLKSNVGFNSEFFQQLAVLEEKNFWFQSRNILILWALQKYAPDFHSLLEIGCGTGYVLSGIAKAYPQKRLQGSELFPEGLSFAEKRLPNIELMQMDSRNIPFIKEFDCIGAFDVLEHIEEDDHVLSQIYQSLNAHGVLILTVPQHQWLWGPADEYACHVRRYSANTLHQKLRHAGFNIVRSTSFVFSLLPAMIASRTAQKIGIRELDPYKELNTNPIINSFFKKILSYEIKLIKKGINFPIGGSRLIIAKKDGE